MTTIPPFFDYNSTTDPVVLAAGTEADAIVDDFYAYEWGAPELHSLIATAIINAELRGRATAQADAARLRAATAPVVHFMTLGIPDGMPDDRTVARYDNTRLTAGEIRVARAALEGETQE